MSTVYKCPSCQTKIRYGSNFCQHCGIELEWDEDDSADMREDDVVYAYGLASSKGTSDSARRIMLSTADAAFGVIGGVLIGNAVRGAMQKSAENKGYKRLDLYHDGTRLYGTAPNRKHDVINYDLHEISFSCDGSNRIYKDFRISIPKVRKEYVFHGVYKPELFVQSIVSARKGNFDSSIYVFNPCEKSANIVISLPEPSDIIDESYDETEEL